MLFYHDQIPEALERRVVGSVEMVTVCGRNHPLAAQKTVDCQGVGAISPVADVDPNQRLPRQRGRQPAGVARRQLLRAGRMAYPWPGLGLVAPACRAIPGLSEPDGRTRQRMDPAGPGCRAGVAPR